MRGFKIKATRKINAGASYANVHQDSHRQSSALGSNEPVKSQSKSVLGNKELMSTLDAKQTYAGSRAHDDIMIIGNDKENSSHTGDNQSSRSRLQRKNRAGF